VNIFIEGGLAALKEHREAHANVQGLGDAQHMGVQGGNQAAVAHNAPRGPMHHNMQHTDPLHSMPPSEPMDGIEYLASPHPSVTGQSSVSENQQAHLQGFGYVQNMPVQGGNQAAVAHSAPRLVQSPMDQNMQYAYRPAVPGQSNLSENQQAHFQGFGYVQNMPVQGGNQAAVAHSAPRLVQSPMDHNMQYAYLRAQSEPITSTRAQAWHHGPVPFGVGAQPNLRENQAPHLNVQGFGHSPHMPTQGGIQSAVANNAPHPDEHPNSQYTHAAVTNSAPGPVQVAFGTPSVGGWFNPYKVFDHMLTMFNST
jgi:hypothetical protein